MNEWLKKYPWTKVVDNRVEPWRLISSSWFDDLEEDMPGWVNIAHTMCAAVQDIINKHPNNFVSIIQFKEKFGEARVYYEASEDIYLEVCKVIDAFIRASARTCIKCGAAGEIRGNLNWILPLCDTCYEETLKRIKRN
jgi:hypothetical protein